MVAPQTSNTNYLTSLLSVTQDGYIKMVQDNVFNKAALLFVLKDKAQLEVIDGGKYLQIPLMIEGNTAATSYSYYDVLDTTPQKGMVDAYVTYSHYTAPVVISRQERKENAGVSKVADYLAARLSQANLSIKDKINKDLFKDGTGNGGKDILGLKAMCEWSATPGAYEGVTDATYWVNEYVTASEPGVLAGLDSAFYGVSDGSDAPDIIVTNGNGMKLYEKYNRTSGVGINYVNNKLADGGFIYTSFKGIPMVLDQSSPDYSTGLPVFWMLNSNYIGFKFGDSEVTEFQRVPKQNVDEALVNIDCQLYSNRRNRQAVLAITST